MQQQKGEKMGTTVTTRRIIIKEENRKADYEYGTRIITDKDSLYEALYKAGEVDGDFDGTNGSEYLWEEAEGYDSNLDYVMTKVKGINKNTPFGETLVFRTAVIFFEEWLGRDDYYANCSFDITKIEGIPDTYILTWMILIEM